MRIAIDRPTLPLFQYFRWVGSFLLVALFAANWRRSAPISGAPRSDVPLDQKITIRIRTDHKWRERVVFDTTLRLAPEATVDLALDIGASEILPPMRSADLSMRSPKLRQCPSDRLSGRPALPRKGRSRTLYQSAKGYHEIAHRWRRKRASLSPIRFASCQEKVHAFTHKCRQLTSQIFLALPHQSPHQHRKQNKVHEDLRRG